jgi:hypothetical protein
MVAPQLLLKKNKGQGFTYFYITKNCQFLQYTSAYSCVWGFVFGIYLVYKIWKTIAERKTGLEFALKEDYFSKVLRT